jgi:hypothetical protein
MRRTNFEEGQTYEFTLSDDTVLTLQFKGLGAQFQEVWFEPSTGATIHPLPPYRAVKKV